MSLFQGKIQSGGEGKKRLRIFSTLLLLIVALTLFDLFWFAWDCRAFVGGNGSEFGVLGDLPVTPDEAIVVLTGDSRRIAKAFELLRKRHSPWLIISGANKKVALAELVNQQGDSSWNIHEVWEKVVMESRSNSTVDNAKESREILNERKVHRVILVTSDYHMVRTLRIFNKYAPEFTYLPIPVPSEISREFDLFSSHTMTGLWKLWVEYLKLNYFRLLQIF